MAAERPRVFQPGTLTVVHGRLGQAVYAGASLMTMAVSVSCDRGAVQVAVRAPEGAEEGVLDQEMRAATACGASVTRAPR